MSDYRGVYRGVYSVLFDDPDFLALSPPARHVLLTVRLCPQATAAALFRYYPATLLTQTGLTWRVLDRALRELAEPLAWSPRGDAVGSGAGLPLDRRPWIVYDDLVMWVRNGLRFDPHVRIADDKHLKWVERAVAGLPHSQIVVTFCEYYRLPRPFDDPPKALGRPSEGGSPPSPIPRPRPRSEKDPPHTPPPRGALDRFQEFWVAYPRKVGKAAAEQAWRRLAPVNGLVQTILAAVARHRATSQWAEGSRFIPHAATWLRGKRWEDELPPAEPILTPKTQGNVAAARAFVASMEPPDAPH